MVYSRQHKQNCVTSNTWYTTIFTCMYVKVNGKNVIVTIHIALLQRDYHTHSVVMQVFVEFRR